jgi:2'-5' RNA ligase
MSLTKYFIAIVPPEPVFSEIENIKRVVSENYNNKSALRSPAHITLHMPFQWKEEKENILIEKLKLFSYPDTFKINLKNYSGFEPRVLFVDVIKNNSLDELQNNLVQFVKVNFNIFNQADDKRGFRPHVTIAFRDLKKELYYKAIEEYRQKTFDAEFLCNSFCLLKHTGKHWLVKEEFCFVA